MFYFKILIKRNSFLQTEVVYTKNIKIISNKESDI